MENASFGLQAASYGFKEQGKRLMDKRFKVRGKENLRVRGKMIKILETLGILKRWNIGKNL